MLFAIISVAAQEVPGAARVATGQPATLSFEQAVRLAIENNLATLRAHERRNEARGLRQQSLAPLLLCLPSVLLFKKVRARDGTTPMH